MTRLYLIPRHGYSAIVGAKTNALGDTVYIMQEDETGDTFDYDEYKLLKVIRKGDFLYI